MAQTDRLIEAFKSCAGPYPWRDFEKLMRALGYEKSPSGGGSGRKFKHPDTK
ncbi:type II toxin-antitoxin system HicA family toxin, partial [Bradyrhizobium sp.]|uniref:type II toxin-antitoxin system HicA family toxin n=1 Tax=Bradyrhizobium sp. TaxID=376 RepID=UPI003C751E7E